MLRKKPRLLFSLLGLLGAFSLAGSTVQAESPANALTRPESLSGWTLLFDGKTTDGWRNYKQDKVSDGWKVVDGALVREGKGAGDIITDKEFKYFELSLEYKISEGGNSGLMFHVTEENDTPWQSGPEIQVQDNVAGHDPQKAGWLYQMYKPGAASRGGEPLDATRPAGEWNQLYLRIAANQCEVDMNGTRYFTFNLGDDKWKELVAKSKFAAYPGFGAAGKGHLCLQDHGNLVSYRSIKIRELPDDGKVQQPIDGTLKLKGELAFPKLKWEGVESIDDGGNVRKLRIMELTFAKGDSKRLFAVAQRGTIYTFENNRDTEQASLFLDLQDKVSQWNGPGANEQGLLGLALHPQFVDNGQFFVCYTAQDDDRSVISRFRVSKDNPNQADPASEEVLLEVPQPFKNHNGGSMEFGHDGFLYVAFGDGGLRNDPNANGQDRSTLLGSVIRIDVDTKSGDLAYGIPRDNPLVNVAGTRPEIYAYGLRNPWRISFDSKTGRLWCGDVGQELWEEVNVLEKGGNYGWSNREGTHPFGNRPEVDGVSQPIEPVWEYDHSVGKSITGGRVYNAARLPDLQGKYIYADYVSGGVWALTYDAKTGTASRNEQVIAGGIPVLAFGEDPSGEVYYFIDSARGECIYRFAAAE
ncbi:family 16 glycoside hydrolase [Aureliella helgolandensis]|uniref:Soluble aldose sugar dehydrogenase YliI n=1 Tax=Aureliella helgolandensis TaxID=2527968 RepID=A0A518GCL6_9BACT|nr:family 16 glycoside hydrolase [Aureliella helgolandensis]QDV26300.1 Soluble aldose sugar dehydrogenase YliI precursor [Aureliella helgolandensis]